MLRWPLKIATLVSLLLCAMMSVLWFRSFHAVQQVTVYRVHRYSAAIDHGRFMIQRCTYSQFFTGEDGPVAGAHEYSEHWKVIFGSRPVDDTNGECDNPADPVVIDGIVYSRPSQETRDDLASGPVWPIVLLIGLPGMIVLARRLQHIPMKPGHCRRCGYDLRASTDRCPECGKPISS